MFESSLLFSADDQDPTNHYDYTNENERNYYQSGARDRTSEFLHDQRFQFEDDPDEEEVEEDNENIEGTWHSAFKLSGIVDSFSLSLKQTKSTVSELNESISVTFITFQANSIQGITEIKFFIFSRNSLNF
jgi:hypothetical protein